MDRERIQCDTRSPEVEYLRAVHHRLGESLAEIEDDSANSLRRQFAQNALDGVGLAESALAYDEEVGVCDSREIPHH